MIGFHSTFDIWQLAVRAAVVWCHQCGQFLGEAGRARRHLNEDASGQWRMRDFECPCELEGCAHTIDTEWERAWKEEVSMEGGLGV